MASNVLLSTALLAILSLIYISLPSVSPINLNWNRGRANAIGNDGSISVSDAQTFGVQAGIRQRGGAFQPLYHQSGGQSNSFSSGQRAPKTWASGDSKFGPGNFAGKAGAGFEGGFGTAHTLSRSKQVAIPLDNEGTVLYHNLKPKKKPASQDSF